MTATWSIVQLNYAVSLDGATHAVLPVTSGTRKSLVGWYRGPTWR